MLGRDVEAGRGEWRPIGRADMVTAVSSPVYGGNSEMATSIMACMNSATEMSSKLSAGLAPLGRHVLLVRCVAGSDTVIHDAQAAPR